jgi:hypothetical protein
MRILITGSRRWTDQDALHRAIAHALVGEEHATVVHGGAPGADTCADAAARLFGLKVESHPADWTTCSPDCRHTPARTTGGRYCPAAGPRRNQAMVDLGADVCLAFPLPGSLGTWDMVHRARRAGIPVQICRAGAA